MTPRRPLVALYLLALVPALPRAVVAAPPEFTLQSIPDRHFHAVEIWAPPPRASGHSAYETIILLHGNQATTDDSTWMTSLHHQPRFSDRILIAPAIADNGYEWGNRDNTTALRALLDRLRHDYPIDPRSTYLLGYSAGASRVLSVARALDGKLAAIIAVAGDIARPLRDTRTPLTTFSATPIHLICFTNDPGPHTNCRLNRQNLAYLKSRGLTRLTLTPLPGTHALDFTTLAPTLDALLSPH